jgi:hypothetical protein
MPSRDEVHVTNRASLRPRRLFDLRCQIEGECAEPTGAVRGQIDDHRIEDR